MKKFFNFGRKNTIEFISLIPMINEELLYPPIESITSQPRKWQKKRAQAFKKSQSESKCPFSKHPAAMDVVRCPGIKSFIDSGYSIRMWSDLYIDLPENPSSANEIKYDFGLNLKNALPAEAKKFTSLNYHKKEDFPELFENDRIYDYIIKIRIPWKIKCPPNVAFYFLPDYYSDDPWFAMTPGILDPTIQDELTINLQIFKDQGRIFFHKGMTVCKIIPFEKNKKYKTLTRKITNTEIKNLYDRCLVLNSSFKRDYSGIKKFNTKNL
jgi:hypothetical protein